MEQTERASLTIPLQSYVDHHYVLQQMSRDLATCPLKEPPVEPAEISAGNNNRIIGFYDVKNPIDPEASTKEKLAQLKQLSDENEPILQAFFKTIGTDETNSDRPNMLNGVSRFKLRTAENLFEQGEICLKSNRKSGESIISKAIRPSILQQYPHFRMEHLRDTLRFKAVVCTVEDALRFMHMLINQTSWEVVKLDIDKLLDPKEFGWRFIGCDIKMPNGQLVECYVVFSAMELAKKRSNHNIFERWRWRQMDELKAEELQQYQDDRQRSRKTYDDAFVTTIRRTTFDTWQALFAGFDLSFQDKAHETYLMSLQKQRMRLNSLATRLSITTDVPGIAMLDPLGMSF